MTIKKTCNFGANFFQLEWRVLRCKTSFIRRRWEERSCIDSKKQIVSIHFFNGAKSIELSSNHHLNDGQVHTVICPSIAHRAKTYFNLFNDGSLNFKCAREKITKPADFLALNCNCFLSWIGAKTCYKSGGQSEPSSPLYQKCSLQCRRTHWWSFCSWPWPFWPLQGLLPTLTVKTRGNLIRFLLRNAGRWERRQKPYFFN